MLYQLIQIEQRALWQRRMVWGMVAVMAVMILLVFGGTYFAKTQLESGNANNPDSNIRIDAESAQVVEDNLVWPAGVSNSVVVGGTVGTFLLVILVGAVMGQAYTWRTVSLWLSRGVPRPLYLLGKFTAVILTTLILLAIATALGAFISGGFHLSLRGDLPFNAIDWGILLAALFTTTATILPYAAFVLLLAVVSRSAIVAIGGGLAYTLLIEPLLLQFLPLLGERWQAMTRYLPGGLNATIQQLVPQLDAAAPALVTAEGGLSIGSALVWIVGYTAVFLTLSLAIFQKQDLGG